MDPAVFNAAPKPRSLIEEYTDTPSLPTTTSDWPKISRCIHLESSFNISFGSPALKGSIRFATVGLVEGIYDLKLPSKRLSETGTIVKVQAIPDEDLIQRPFAGLQEYPIRFYLRTTATNDRQGTERVWLIGISTFENAIYQEEAIS